MTRLSHSAKEKMITCGAYFKNHYIDRVRSIELGSPLFFGSAMDDAFGRLLLMKKNEYTDEEKLLLTKSPEQIFLEGMQETEFNGENIDISMYPHCHYFKSDYDARFIDEAHAKLIENLAIEFDNLEDLNEFMERALSRNAKLTENELKIKNYVCWISLIEKGKLMIKQYEKQVMPLIEEVFEIQKKIELPNDKGDTIIGYIDFIASFNDEPGVKYIVDNKTSSRPYKKDSVQSSEQLATYCYHENTNKGAYIVVEKPLRKRDPVVKINIIKDIISEEQFNKTLDQYIDSLYNIEQGHFEKNYESKCFLFGRKCAYYDYCRSDGQIVDGLIKLPERKK